MANKGLYYYKLVSPYLDDVTKDCKLSINEIDSNFKNLKDADIKDVMVDEQKKEIVIERNDGEKMILSLSEINPTLDIEYNSMDGVIEVSYADDKYLISGLLTKDNMSKEIMKKVYSDGTLSGVGVSNKPLGIANVHRTGFYKPVKKIIDLTLNERIPVLEMRKKGDRYLVVGNTSEYGLLYNFDGVKHVDKLLEKSGWRVPTKNDWDDMLNALEPCEYRNHNSALNNRVLGAMAGALLKSDEGWLIPNHDEHHHHRHHDYEIDGHSNEEGYDFVQDENDFDVEFMSCDKLDNKPCHKPEHKPISPRIKSAYGLNILPSGYAYFSRPMKYSYFGVQGAYWTTDSLYDSDIYTKVFTDRDSGVVQVGERPSTFLSIRLVKDYNGSNFNEVENILGQNYGTVLLPSLNNPNGFSIWTTENLRFKDNCILEAEPNGGYGLKKKTIYFIYEWNGKDWDMLELLEGDSIVVLDGVRRNKEFRIVNGNLINIEKEMLKEIKNDVMVEVEIAKARLDAVESTLVIHEGKFDEVNRILDETAVKFNELDTTISGLKDEDSRLDDAIKDLDSVVKLMDAANQERFDSIDTTISNLETKVDEKVAELVAKDEELTKAIETEEAERKDADNNLDKQIKDEATSRRAADAELTALITQESLTRKAEDVKLQTSINNVSNRLDSTNKTLADEISKRNKQYTETTGRLEVLEGKELVGGDDGCSYDVETGILTLKAVDDKNTIKVQFSNNFGTLKLKPKR